MTTGSSIVEEPRFTVQSRPKPFFRRRRFLWQFAPAASAAAVGMVLLLVSGTSVVPFEPVVTLEGKMASKSDFFEDPEVQRLLMKHRIRVHITRTGSRDVAVHDLNAYDFVFPSGEQAASLIRTARAGKEFPRAPRLPFVTPIVLATYRWHAEALKQAGIAAPRSNEPDPLYYTLDLEKFLNASEAEKTWNDLNVSSYRDKNGNSHTSGNRVLAQTSDPCLANSGANYLALVAYIRNGKRVPQRDADGQLAEVTRLANQIRPLAKAQGYTSADLSNDYVTDAGWARPIVVIYEHQYLAYQLATTEKFGRPDTDRVLLYPSFNLLTRPQFMGLNANGERLGELITFDPELQRRAMELGFRTLVPTGNSESSEWAAFLGRRGVPVPSKHGDESQTPLPETPVMEQILKTVGDGC